jgi:toxin-antitoxin system PIN domain toxin
MRIVDVNILLYAVNRNAPQYAAIRPWWECALAADEPVGLAWSVLTAFVRLATRPHVFTKPLSVADALTCVDEWIAHANTRIVLETERHWEILREYLKRAGTAANLTSDAHLAALAVEYGAKLSSCDADFVRFKGLRWENPLHDSKD